MLSSKNVLILITGSVSAYKVCVLISLLIKEKANVQCVLSKSAEKFIGQATLEGLTSNKVLISSFENGNMMAHIDLCKWVDFAILAPATAKTINHFSQGTGEGLLFDILLAWPLKQKPLFLAPAMNTQMLNHPSTQNSLAILKSWNVEILPTQFGTLACGDTGLGRLLEPNDILHKIKAYFLKNRSIYSPRVLITYGGTDISLDSVRKIKNSSTGKTGFYLAENLQLNGFDVTTIRSYESPKSLFVNNDNSFNDYDELKYLLQDKISTEHFDYIIHLAAVSDYKLKNIVNEKNIILEQNSKISSQNKEIVITLIPTEKLINQIRNWSQNKDIYVVGFKLTSTKVNLERENAIFKIINESPLNLLVHNDSHDRNSLKDKHIFSVYNSRSEKEVQCFNKNELFHYLLSKFLSISKSKLVQDKHNLSKERSYDSHS
jgi:phosphopantothenoylcysteine decarboxylase/phosphopantothenate--cysteine ligase